MSSMFETEMMDRCCTERGKPDYGLMLLFMEEHGKSSFSLEELEKIKAFCEPDRGGGQAGADKEDDSDKESANAPTTRRFPARRTSGTTASPTRTPTRTSSRTPGRTSSREQTKADNSQEDTKQATGGGEDEGSDWDSIRQFMLQCGCHCD